MEKEIRFKDLKETRSYLKMLHDTDIWSECYISELSSDTEGCGLKEIKTGATEGQMVLSELKDSVLSKAGIPENRKRIADLEASVTGSNMAITLPVNGRVQTEVVSSSCLNYSLPSRAGLNGKSLSIDPTILDRGLRLYGKEMALCLLRLTHVGVNELGNPEYEYELKATNSGSTARSGGYAILPQFELNECLYNTLSKSFSSLEFYNGSYSDEMTIIDYALESDSKIIKDIEAKLGVSIKPVVRFTTNDIAERAASLHGALLIENRLIYLGGELKLSHSHGHDIVDWKKCCEHVFSLIRDTEDNLEELSNREIKNPKEAFRNVLARLKISEKNKEIKQAFDEFMLSEKTAFDLIFSLWGIPERMAFNNEPQIKVLDYQEKIAKASYLNWNSIDKPSIFE